MPLSFNPDSIPIPDSFSSINALIHLRSAANLQDNLTNITNLQQKMVVDASNCSNNTVGEVWNPVQMNIQATVVAATNDGKTLASLANQYLTLLQTTLNAPTQASRVGPLWTFVATLRNTEFTYKPAFDAFKTIVLTAVAGYDSEMAVNDPNNTNADMTALVNAFPASVDTARASLDNLDNFLSALEQDLAAVLVWAIRNPVGSEDNMPESLKVLKVTGKCVFSSSEATLTSWAQDLWTWVESRI